MSSDRLRIDGIVHWQNITQQIRHLGERDRRAPFRFQVHHLRAGAFFQPPSHGTKRPRTGALTSAAVPAWIRHLDLAEHGLDGRPPRVFAGMPLTTTGARTLPLQMFTDLVRYNEVLHASKQCFAFSEVHAQSLHRQPTGE